LQPFSAAKNIDITIYRSSEHDINTSCYTINIRICCVAIHQYIAIQQVQYINTVSLQLYNLSQLSESFPQQHKRHYNIMSCRDSRTAKVGTCLSWSLQSIVQ